MTAQASPVPPRERINAVDALRGFALFGVLAINLNTEFRVTFFEQFRFVRLGRLDSAAQAVLSLGFEFKAIALFSLLFGAGLAIQFDRLAENPRRMTLLVRRLLVLLAFGLIHLFLIWNGDILTEYALAGLLVLPFLYAPASLSLAAATLLFLLYLFMGKLPLPFSFPDAAWISRHIAEAREVYGHGTLGEVALFRIAEVPALATFLAYVFFRTVALMLFGAWVWRTGLLRQLGQRAAWLRSWGAALIATGLLLSLEQYGFLSLAKSWAAAESLIVGTAPVVLALGYAALLLGFSGWSRIQPLFRQLGAVGRMAFTNYIAQSIVMTVLFYGFGFGLMGRVGVAAGLGLSTLIFSAQAWGSGWWLKRYRFGPLEWLWRCLMYGAWQPWKKPAGMASAAAAGALP